MNIKPLVICFVFVLTLFVFNTPNAKVHALNAFIDPNGNGATGNWTTTGANHYTEIDEATRQPTVPNTGDYISGEGGKSNQIFINMSTFTAFNVSQVTVWVHHNDGANGQVFVQLFDDNQTTARSTRIALPQTTTNAWHSITFAGLSLTQTQLNQLSIAFDVEKNGGGQAAFARVNATYADVTYTDAPPPPTSYEQSSFRFFNSINSTNVGTPLAGQNANAILNSLGQPFRLRMNIHVAGTGIAINGQSFNLQYVGRGSGSCAAPSGGTPATYTNITTGTLISYNNLTSGVNDGDALTPNANDPTHGSDTIKKQSVEESNTFTNNQTSLPIGEDGMWDFALIDNGAPAATTYCIRAVLSSGTVLNTYSQYPQITTGNGVLAVDIVNAVNNPVANPEYAMSGAGYLFLCDATTTTIGTASQKIRISNYTGTPSWSVSIAATAGETSQWSNGGAQTYDYNDTSGTPSGCSDGGDADIIAGLLSLNPSTASSTPQGGCSNSGISFGSSAGFAESTVSAITLVTANASAELGCTWDITGINASQQIPADQAAGNYSINLTLTATAI